MKKSIFILLLISAYGCKQKSKVEASFFVENDNLSISIINNTDEDLYFLNYFQFCHEIKSNDKNNLIKNNCLQLIPLEYPKNEYAKVIEYEYKNALEKEGFSANQLLISDYPLFVLIKKRETVNYLYKMTESESLNYQIVTPYDYIKYDGLIMKKRINALKSLSNNSHINYKLYLGDFYLHQKSLLIK